MGNQTNNLRIAKNTIYLYIRTILVMLISLYTSRVVLKVLGETDLGIYNLVGGIVTLMSFLQTAQTKATSRYITYELGRNGDKKELTRIYSLCVSIHILIAAIVFILAETIGLWLINECTNIPSKRIITANLVYQFSILTFIIHFLRNPLDSIIIAHEEMSVYAYMSIVEVILQLGVVYGLMCFSTDRLGLYGLMVLCVAIILFLCFLFYKNKKYPYYKFHFIWNKKESLSILSFSGWTLLGSSSNTLTQQGVSLLFNNFVGLVANTALGFANQVNGAVGRFVSSFTTAFNPQIVKLEAQNDKESLYRLMNRASKFSFSLCYLIALPLIANMDSILCLWLVDVPLYTKEFCQLILVCSIIDATTGVFNTTITATGRIRNYQVCIAFSFLLDFILSFILLHFKLYPALVFGSRILTRGIFNMIIGMRFVAKQVNFPILLYIKEVIIPILCILIITIPFSFIKPNSAAWFNLVFNFIVCGITSCIGICFIIMNKNERHKIFSMVKKKLKNYK